VSATWRLSALRGNVRGSPFSVVRAQEWHCARQQDGRHAAGDQPRPALHVPRQATEKSGIADLARRWFDPVRPYRQQRRNQGQAGEQGEQRRRDAAERERVEDGVAEREQAGKRRRDGQR
jgi:hypothetical protein